MRLILRCIAVASASAALLTSTAAAQRGAGRGNTAPITPQPERNANIPPIVGAISRTLRDSLTVPRGFSVEYFADSVPRARFMALGPDGSVYLSQSMARGPNMGYVRRLLDTNNDGRADVSEIVLDSLERPHGLAVRDGFLYVAELRKLSRFKLDARGKPSLTGETLAEYPFTSSHWSRSIVFGADGALYLAAGSSCNICIEKDSMIAAVTRFDADGRNGRVYSRGLRNAVGMALHPTTGEIWVSSHERDNLQPDFQDAPPEEINILRQGGHYGWPYCHSERVPNPDAVVADSVAKGVCASTIAPALAIQAHAAPLGMTFLARATMFPPEYRGDMLLVVHGSWNRSIPVAPAVLRVIVRDGKPISYEEMVTGWQTGYRGSSGVRWGRPADVMVYRDGSVLISDDQKGVIYRLYR